MNCKYLITAFVLSLTCISHAAPRSWKSADGSRSFQGELIKRESDKITIKKLPSGQHVVLKPEQLHASDLEWLKNNHPFEHEKPVSKATHIAEGAFYDTLAFGDDRNTCIKKLKASPRFQASSSSVKFFGNSAGSERFSTTEGNEFFGMQAELQVGWDDQRNLEHLDLVGHQTASAKTKANLLPKFKTMARHIDKYFGQAVHSSSNIEYARLGEGEITFTHVWSLKSGGSLLMGVGKQDNSYAIIARFISLHHSKLESR